MKTLLTAAFILTFSGATFADQRDHLNLSFQDHEHFSTNQPATGSADVDYVNASFQDNIQQAYGQSGFQPEIGGTEMDYLNESFQDSY